MSGHVNFVAETADVLHVLKKRKLKKYTLYFQILAKALALF